MEHGRGKNFSSVPSFFHGRRQVSYFTLFFFLFFLLLLLGAQIGKDIVFPCIVLLLLSLVHLVLVFAVARLRTPSLCRFWTSAIQPPCLVSRDDRVHLTSRFMAAHLFFSFLLGTILAVVAAQTVTLGDRAELRVADVPDRTSVGRYDLTDGLLVTELADAVYYIKSSNGGYSSSMRSVCVAPVVDAVAVDNKIKETEDEEGDGEVEGTPSSRGQVVAAMQPAVWAVCTPCHAGTGWKNDRVNDGPVEEMDNPEPGSEQQPSVPNDDDVVQDFFVDAAATNCDWSSPGGIGRTPYAERIEADDVPGVDDALDAALRRHAMTATEPVVLVQWERSVGRPESYLLGAVVTLAVSALGYGLVVRYAIGTVATGSSPTCFKDQ